MGRPDTGVGVAPNLGHRAGFYLTTHGYTDQAKCVIASTYFTYTKDESAFVEHLNSLGMSQMEALYIYTLIVEAFETYEVVE